MKIRHSLKSLAGACLALLLTGCEQDYGVDQYEKPVSASDIQQRWLVINYWATWCAPCAKEIPELNQLSETLESSRYKVIGVNFDGLEGAELTQASEKMGIRFTVLAQDPAQRFGIARSQVLPVTHIVGPDGRLRASLPGEQTAQKLLARLKALEE